MKSRNVYMSMLLLASYGSGCATMDQSLQLGVGLGATTGAVATYGGYSAGGESPSLSTVAIGAGIGAALGLITSYFTHKSVVEDRKEYESDQIEMHFGDLPPSPFIVPKNQSKKGSK
jgi:hypothetical protein